MSLLIKTPKDLVPEKEEKEFDLRTAACMVEADCESYLNKMMFEDKFYSEGNEEQGFIDLKTILEEVEKIVNCDDYLSGDISFMYFVRPETPEESEDAGHSNDVEWWTKEESLEINKLYIQFEG